MFFTTETVTMLSRTLTGYDDFKEPIWEDIETDVSDVLVAPGNTSDLTGNTRTDGDTVVFTLYFPASYIENLRNTRIRVRGSIYRTVGDPQPYTGSPLKWNRVVTVEAVNG